MKRIAVEIEGTHPLLMHSPESVDPTNPLVKQIKELTSKGSKKRTDYDDEIIDKLSFELATYHNGEFVYIPDMAVIGTIRDGAKSMRAGKEITSGIDVEETEIPLIYDGPKDVDGLYQKRFVDRRVVVVNRARIMRVRTRFNAWKLKFTLLVNPSVIAPDKVKRSLEFAGSRCGLLDGRPRFGRYLISAWKEIN